MSSTIFDVAKRANVSIGTVSRVLNKRDRVRPETRERVLLAIQELDYHSNALAQGLASQQTDTIGLVIPQVNDPFYFGIVRGIEDTVTTAGYSLLIASQPHHTSENHYMRLFRRGHVDALILTAVDVFPNELQEMMKGGLPVILVQQDAGKHVSAVQADNYGGACALTEHLLEHGYRRIAYITGTDHTPDNQERMRGIRDTLAAHGLTLPQELVFRGDYLRGSGSEAMRQILDLPERPDAVFAGNDQMAADAIVAAQERGLRVPGDIAVVGFDDVPLASYVSPSLTTVRQPIYEQGVYAARTALDMLKSDGKQPPLSPPRIILPTTLVIRRSCGCEV
ncbi:MAG: LacI family DNA-binding transcriptional regulator [Anaerolineae bacterium]|nr:LacI family DNA-binding transcriptional regulator [Anaerolineae bacterium]